MRINNVRKKRRFRELVILLLCMITAAGLMPMHARAETEQQTQSGGGILLCTRMQYGIRRS